MRAAVYADAVAVAAAAFEALAAKEAEHRSALEREIDERRSLASDVDLRAKLVEMEDNDNARRHLDGEDAVVEAPRRAQFLAKLNALIPHRKAAIPILKQRAADAGQKAEAARAPFTGAVLEAVSMIQTPACEKIREILAEMEGPLIDLLTADLIRMGTIGDRYSVPAGQQPSFNGETIVRKLLDSISPHLSPPGFTFDHIEAQARDAATAAIHSIKEY